VARESTQIALAGAAATLLAPAASLLLVRSGHDFDVAA